MENYIGVSHSTLSEDLQMLNGWWGEGVVNATLEKVYPDDEDEDPYVELKPYDPNLTEQLKTGLNKFLDHMEGDVDALKALVPIVNDPQSYVHTSIQTRIDVREGRGDASEQEGGVGRKRARRTSLKEEEDD